MITEIVTFFMAPLRRVDIRQVVADSLAAHDNDIVELNLQQLAEGKTATGADIKPFYRPLTIKLRRQQGLQTDHVDLYQKGGFYRGIYARRVAGGEEVSSTDPKTEDLVERYSVEIFGLSVSSREQLADRMRPTLQTNFNQALLG